MISKLEILEMWRDDLEKVIGFYEELEEKELIVTEQDINDAAFEGKKDPCDDEAKAHFDNRADWADLKVRLQLVESLIDIEKKRGQIELSRDLRKMKQV